MDGHVEYARSSWPAEAGQLPVIRRAVRSWLGPLTLDEQDRAGMVQAVDEAATNVVDHAYGPTGPGTVELTLWTEPDAVCIEVVDHGQWRAPTVDTCQGLGIPLMRGMVQTVLIRFGPDGSRVLLRHPL